MKIIVFLKGKYIAKEARENVDKIPKGPRTLNAIAINPESKYGNKNRKNISL